MFRKIPSLSVLLANATLQGLKVVLCIDSVDIEMDLNKFLSKILATFH